MYGKYSTLSMGWLYRGCRGLFVSHPDPFLFTIV